MSETNENVPRDTQWLKERLSFIIASYFPDVAQGYPITVSFGIRARYRFGTIIARGGQCIIRLNQLFTDPEVPLYVIDETLAHEFVHYAHGFGSGLPRLYEHPHKGGIIEAEFERRGFTPTHHMAEAWRKQNWAEFYQARCGVPVDSQLRQVTATPVQWDDFMNQHTCRTTDELVALFLSVHSRLGIQETPEIQNVGWVFATTRQQALSYYYPKSKRVNLHGLLADRRVPESVLVFELAYWIIRRHHSGKWERIQAVMAQKGLKKTEEEALAWRKKSWMRFRNLHHPLNKL